MKWPFSKELVRVWYRKSRNSTYSSEILKLKKCVDASTQYESPNPEKKDKRKENEEKMENYGKNGYDEIDENRNDRNFELKCEGENQDNVFSISDG